MHLLVVEDDERLSRALRRLLEEDRPVVDVASDGETGLAIAEGGTGLEAVVLGVAAPGMSPPGDPPGARGPAPAAGPRASPVKPSAYEELAPRLRALSRRSASP